MSDTRKITVQLTGSAVDLVEEIMGAGDTDSIHIAVGWLLDTARGILDASDEVLISDEPSSFVFEGNDVRILHASSDVKPRIVLVADDLVEIKFVGSDRLLYGQVESPVGQDWVTVRLTPMSCAYARREGIRLDGENKNKILVGRKVVRKL